MTLHVRFLTDSIRSDKIEKLPNKYMYKYTEEYMYELGKPRNN